MMLTIEKPMEKRFLEKLSGTKRC